jgi:uncharacterized protein (TIGR03437 family)
VQSTVATAPSSGAFQILGKPDRSKFYLISANAAGAITALDSTFANPKPVGGAIALAPSVAAISPDGKWLVVGAGSTAYVIGTSSDAVALTAPVQGTIKDLAFSLDSATAFVLSNTSAAGFLTPITLPAAGSSPTAAAPIALDDLGNAIATGPNGLLYMAIANRFETFNTQTLQKVAGDIAVTGQPQKPVFTSDGKYAFSSNPSASGTAVWQFDLQNHLIAASLPSFGATFDRLLLVNDTRILAVSSQFQAVYDVTVAQPGVLQVTRTALPFSNVQSIVVSNESPARTTYLLSNDSGQTALNQADLTTNTKTASVPVTAAAGQLINFLPVVQITAPTTLQAYGAVQTLAAGATSVPLVVRALNATGQPVMGVSVTFSIPAGAGVLSAATAVTNSDGYAQTYFTAPSTPGSVTVTATAAGLTPVTFTMTVPSAGGGGGPGTPGVSIASGNGQLVPPQFPTKPLTVLVTDAGGAPLANVTVTFTITQGSGSLPTGLTATATTDSNGNASTVFISGLLDPSTSFTQSTITATAPSGSVTFYESTAMAWQTVVMQPDLTSGRTITGGAGQTIPGAVQVQVYATQGPGAGQAISNVGVTLTGAGGTGAPTASCAGGTALTNTQGIATCDVVIGNVLGAGLLILNVGGIDLQSPSISVNVNSGPPTKVTMTGSATSGRPGQQITVTAKVTDANGTGLPNIPLAWQVAQGSATLSSTSASTDANGAGTAIVTLGSTGGAVSVKVTAGSGSSALTQSFSLSVNVPVSNVTAVSGGGQTAVTGAAFAPLVVKVTDAAGGPVNGAAITFTVSSGSATVSPATVNTGSDGQAQATVTAGATAGAVVVTASSGTSSATFNLTVVPPGPPVTTASFTNGASGAPGLTPCGIATVTAPNLVPGLTTTLFGNTFIGPLQTALGGLDISVNGVAAPLFWVMNSGAAFQTPCETQPGNATVVVRVNGSTATVTVPVMQYQPGIFETTFNGQRYAVLVHQNGSYVTLDSPARLGEQITMFATGLGTVTPSTGTNRIGTGGQTVDAPIIAGVNNAGVRVVSATYVPGSIGVYQITFEIPSDTAAGTRQNLALALVDNSGNAIFAPGSFVPIAQ